MNALPLQASMLVISLILTGCLANRTSDTATSAITGTSAQHVVTGRASYRERIMLPPGSRLRVQMIDNQLADTSRAVLAEQIVEDISGPPIAFTLPFDSAKLRVNGQYGLHASLYGPDDKLWFVTDTRVAVTPGDAKPVELRMIRVSEPPPAPVATTTGRASPWKEAAARGVGFRAVGNEPGWFVEVDMGEAPPLRATLDYGERKIEVARMQGLSGLLGWAGKTADGTQVKLLVERTPCQDGMSGEAFEATAKLTVADKRYDGCGTFLFK